MLAERELLQVVRSDSVEQVMCEGWCGHFEIYSKEAMSETESERNANECPLKLSTRFSFADWVNKEDVTKTVPVFVTSTAGGGGGGSEGGGGAAGSERRRRGRRKGSLGAMEGLLGRGERRLWAWQC